VKEILISNPTLIWIKRLLTSKCYEYKYRKNFLKISPQSQIVNSHFGIYCTIYKYAILIDVELGNFSYVNTGSQIIKSNIGKFCCIGENVRCGTANHPSSTFVSVHPIFYSTRKQAQLTFSDRDYFPEFRNVEIGNDVWVGNESSILGGVKIGDGAIVGTRSLVTKDVPPYAIVGGVPAKIIKYRFSQEEVKFLMNFNWWDKDLQWLKKNFKIMHDIKQLMQSQSVC
jgi:acetyltransferase-like isoleucine patch superfamily enzyme